MSFRIKNLSGEIVELSAESVYDLKRAYSPHVPAHRVILMSPDAELDTTLPSIDTPLMGFVVDRCIDEECLHMESIPNPSGKYLCGLQVMPPVDRGGLCNVFSVDSCGLDPRLKYRAVGRKPLPRDTAVYFSARVKYPQYEFPCYIKIGQAEVAIFGCKIFKYEFPNLSIYSDGELVHCDVGEEGRTIEVYVYHPGYYSNPLIELEPATRFDMKYFNHR